MSKGIKLNSYAKINLFLDVIDRRPDGYHNIKSVMQEIDLHDEVQINEIKSGINISCDNYNVPLDEKNTCYKAASLIKEKYDISMGVEILIKKVIPTEAGLAGGSGNAAAVIKGINKLWNLGMSIDEMKEIGVKVGADVPFCLTGGTCLCEGVGDKITELKPFKWDNMIIIKPNFSISTPVVYKNITDKEYNYYKDNNILEYINSNDYYKTCLSVANTLEIAAIKLQPQISLIKDDLINSGAISSLMTGSGSSIYGFYESTTSMMAANDKLSKKYNKTFNVKTLNSKYLEDDELI